MSECIELLNGGTPKAIRTTNEYLVYARTRNDGKSKTLHPEPYQIKSSRQRCLGGRHGVTEEEGVFFFFFSKLLDL